MSAPSTTVHIDLDLDAPESEQHNARELKATALAYVARHAVSVMDTDGWEHLCQARPALQREVIRALALGLPPVMDNDEPRHVETVNAILASCKRHGVVAGIHTNSSKFSQRYIDQGFGMVMLAPDRVAMSNYVKAEAARLTGWSPMKPVSGPSGGGY
jgi:hypothetical protein